MTPGNDNPTDESPDSTTDGASSSGGDGVVVKSPHRRLGYVTRSQDMQDQLARVDEFIHDNPPESIGGKLNDDGKVKACLYDIVDFYHSNLTQDIRNHINGKWGINDEMIDARRIGYISDGSDDIDHLTKRGYSTLTIARAGLATPGILGHLFECRGVTEGNSHLLENEERPTSDCTHTVPEEVDILVRAQIQGVLEPREINLQALFNFLEGTSDYDPYLNTWWDNRLIFPYKNEQNEFSYLIARSTSETNDKVYDTGIFDATGSNPKTLADTNLVQHVDIPSDKLEQFTVTGHRTGVYNTPERPENQPQVEELTSHLEGIIEGQQSAAATHKFGIFHRPNGLDADAEVTLTQPNDEYGHKFSILTPPAMAVSESDTITVKNETEKTATFEVIYTPDDVWWEDQTFQDEISLDCDASGRYKYQISIGENTHNGIVVTDDTVRWNSRNWEVENWVGNEPAFSIDIAKYLKQSISHDWINRNVIEEPLFGIETVQRGKPLIVTEGITDAIMAHQHGFPCIAPATTNIKSEHFEQIPDDITTAYMVNDNEKSEAGIEGALRNAAIFKGQGHDAFIGELPRPDGADKIDLAEFLQESSREDLLAVLEDSTPLEEHPKYDPEKYDPAQQQDNSPNPDGTDILASENEFGSTESDEVDISNDATTTGLTDLSLKDVISWDHLPSTGSATRGDVLYRGVNPHHHRGESENYFVIRRHVDSDTGEEYITAKDYKATGGNDGAYYRALNWLVVAARQNCKQKSDWECENCRDVSNPNGSFSKEEMWLAWRYAKEADHVPLPDDDPIPLRALWHIAEKHDLFPPELIPDSYEDVKNGNAQHLSETPFNRALDIIETEYDLNPGRDPRQ